MQQDNNSYKVLVAPKNIQEQGQRSGGVNNSFTLTPCSGKCFCGGRGRIAAVPQTPLVTAWCTWAVGEEDLPWKSPVTTSRKAWCTQLRSSLRLSYREMDRWDLVQSCANEGDKSRITMSWVGWYRGAGKEQKKSCSLVHLPWCGYALASVKMLGRRQQTDICRHWHAMKWLQNRPLLFASRTPKPQAQRRRQKMRVSYHCLYLHKEISLHLKLPLEYMERVSSSAKDAVSALYKHL